MRNDLNLNQLRAFHFAACCGSISRAADRLCVSQPAVSMQIRALEDQYGLRLFLRGKKKFELTDCGRRLYAFTEKIFAMVREAEDLLSQNSLMTTEVLRIGSTKTCVRYLLAGFIARFQSSFPKIQIRVDEGSSEEMVLSVLERRNDLAIVGRMPYDSKLKVLPFIQDEIVLLTAPGHRLGKKGAVSILDLKDENLILREKGSGTRLVVESVFETRGIAPSTFIETGNVDFIKEMVSMGNAISLLARMGVDADVAKGHLVAMSLAEGPFSLDIDIVVNRERPLSNADQAFLNVLMESASNCSGDSGHFHGHHAALSDAMTQ